MNLFEKLDNLTPPPHIIDTISLTDKAALDLFEATAEAQLFAAQKLHATALAALEDGNLRGFYLPVSTLSDGIVRHYGAIQREYANNIISYFQNTYHLTNLSEYRSIEPDPLVGFIGDFGYAEDSDTDGVGFNDSYENTYNAAGGAESAADQDQIRDQIPGQSTL